jgi:hypothetical protein
MAEPEKPGYNQSAIWSSIQRETVGKFEEKLIKQADEVAAAAPCKVIVHLLFDQNVTPEGNLIYQLMQRANNQKPLTAEVLRLKRYVVDDDGNVVTDHDVPISECYRAIQLYSNGFDGDVVTLTRLDPNRKGDPYFMDNEMVAFGVEISEKGKGDSSSIRNYFRHLFECFDESGIGSVMNFRLIVA